jgi:hypothetical protein
MFFLQGKKIEAIRIFQRLLWKIRLWARKRLLKISNGAANVIIDIVDTRSQSAATPAMLKNTLSIYEAA